MGLIGECFRRSEVCLNFEQTQGWGAFCISDDALLSPAGVLRPSMARLTGKLCHRFARVYFTP